MRYCLSHTLTLMIVSTCAALFETSVSDAAPPPVSYVLPEQLQDLKLEISGAEWVDDHVILLPQYPTRQRARESMGGGLLIEISKDALEIDHSKMTQALTYTERTLKGLSEIVREPGFQGFEAIVWRAPYLYLLVEYEERNHMRGGIFRATMTAGRDFVIDQTWRLDLKTPAQLPNMAFEAMTFISDHELLIIFERNGAKLLKYPKAIIYNLQTGKLSAIRMPPIDHRITDLTRVDHEQRFWAVNYRWEGDKREDLSATPHESLVELRYVNGVITLTGRICSWDAQAPGKNWEAIIKTKRGFVIATDRFPKNIVSRVSAAHCELTASEPHF